MATRLPPHDLEAEQSVLSAIMIDPDAIIKVADLIKPDSFYEPAHQAIYQAMQTLYEKRQPIDAVTLTGQLKKDKKLSAAGGAAGVARISNLVSTAANVVEYAKMVADGYVRRRLITYSGEISEEAFDPGKEAKDILDGAEQRVFSVSQLQGGKSFSSLKDTLVESFERLDELQKSGGEIRGVPSGFADLDHLLAGFQRSNLIILAARPGMGKTAFALNITHHVAVAAKKKVGFFSLEMSREELVDRLLVAQADIDAWRLKTGRLDQQDFLKLSDAMGVLADTQIFIDDTPGLSIFEMRTRARRLCIEHNIDLLVVDYLQLAQGRTKDNRVQEVGEISQGLKNIARELKIPVLALAQLSRAIENRGEKIPQLSDLRESGCVTGDTLVTLADSGQRVTIAQLKGKKDFAVWSLNLDTYKLERSVVTNTFVTGIKLVYKLTTKLGKVIKATANHKFLTINGWKRLDGLKTEECIALLQNLAVSDIYWDQIKSVEYVGVEEVFDLTVPTHQNFVANDIVIHNSIEQDADVVMFLYRKDDEIREAVNLRISKHRNGALGDVDLFFKGDRIKFYGMEKRQG
ncbi:MAG: replicative DNA helicase [Candidatus Pacebacteria bacterium CG10_big_fil_rev_8_21_14_0_10_44_11]|nr:MAG: replicative DNA helicase [Candidatus Pacebacteria bacterium CG10_big_fil_rev_8_21_14_0_10_44_11]